MKIKKIVAILLCVVFFGVILTGCSTGLSHKSLEGTWQVNYDVEIIFRDEVYVYTGYGTTVSGVYEIKGDRLILRSKSGTIFLEFDDVKISGEWLNCSYNGNEMSWNKI